jgi:hypothetical protein
LIFLWPDAGYFWPDMKPFPIIRRTPSPTDPLNVSGRITPQSSLTESFIGCGGHGHFVDFLEMFVLGGHVT